MARIRDTERLHPRTPASVVAMLIIAVLGLVTPCAVAQSDAATLSSGARAVTVPEGRDIVSNDWCRVLFAPRWRHLALSVLADAGASRIKVRSRIGRPVPDGVTIEIVEDVTELVLRSRAATGSECPDWAAAIAWPPANLILMRADAAYPMDERVSPLLLHEFTHLALGRASDGSTGHRRKIPHWFEEGVAQWVAGAPKPSVESDLRPAAFFGSLMDRPAMAAAFLGNENAAQAAYAHTRGWVSWMARVGGYDAPRKVLDHLLDDDLSFDDAVRLGAGLSPVLIDDGWRDHLKSDLSWVPGFLGQLLFGAILVAAVVLGSRKVALRRTKVMDKWAKEEPPVLDPPTTPPQPLP